MKKIISAVFILFMLVLSANSQRTVYTMSSGDTTFTANFSNVKAVFITIRDSSISGTDSIYIGYKDAYSGITFLSTITLRDLSQTTYTTIVTSSLVIPADNTTKTYVWYPSGGIAGTDLQWSGSLFFRRLNVNDNVTPYVPKTRFIIEGF